MKRIHLGVLLAATATLAVDCTVQIQPQNTAEEYETPMQKFRRSMSEIRALGMVLESYAVDRNQFPPAGTPVVRIGAYEFCAIESLSAPLQLYKPRVSPFDPYDRPYLYWVSQERQRYAVLCQGSGDGLRRQAVVDTLVDGLSRAGQLLRPIDIQCFQDPILLADGQFLTHPKGTVRDCR